MSRRAEQDRRAEHPVIFSSAGRRRGMPEAHVDQRHIALGNPAHEGDNAGEYRFRLC